MRGSHSYLRVAGGDGETLAVTMGGEEEAEDWTPMSASFGVQLKAALVRNLIRKKRNRRHTLRELLGPIYFLAIIIILRVAMPSPFFEEVLSPPGDSQAFNTDLLKGKAIAVSPDSSEIEKFLQHMQTFSNFKHNFTLYKTESDIDAAYEEDFSSVQMALIFSQIDNTLQYKIRVATVEFPSFSFSLPPGEEKYSSPEQCRKKYERRQEKEFRSKLGSVHEMAANIPQFLFQNFMDNMPTELELPLDCPVTSYYWSGFSTLQMMVEHTWLQIKNSSHEFPHIELEQLPKSSYTGTMETVLRAILPLYMTISISQFLTPMLMVVVLEKEKRIKESLRMVGLRDSVFWLSWFFVYGILILCISIIGSTLVNFVVFNTTRSYYPVVFFLMLEFGLSIIMFAFVMTALFSKAKAAGLAGGLTILMISCLYYLQVFLQDSSNWVFWCLGLLSPTAFAMSMDKILQLDINGIPLSSDVMWDSDATGIPLGGAMIMIGLDIFLYGFLAAWLDNIIPTEYGISKPPWFCFLPSYWLSRPAQKATLVDQDIIESDDIERLPPSMEKKEAIVIQHLRKTFTGINKKPVHAVQDVSLKIYSGEITAILGHNGAGKSTLFNMLTGMTAPTEGRAHIFGYDVRNHDQMEEIRKMTGICPQHDVLFDELTPREHLQFFAKIRGIPDIDIEAEVDSILTDIDLVEKADAVAEKLSGGQKRKLSVGIALIGDPKLIFLDEPTAGVDPYSRRHLWSVLKKRKAGKVILLTTHFMDEADILADRKAIVTKGKIRCYGSSLFLKNRFGIGYHLTMVLKAELGLGNIKNLVTESVPGSKQARHYGKEISFVLPREEVHTFPQLFQKIEHEIEASDNSGLGISSYGVSMTTLEEVFLHLGEEEEEAEEVEEKSSSLFTFLRGKKGKISHSDEYLARQQTGEVTNGIIHSKHDNDSHEAYSFESVATAKSAWQAYRALVYIRFIRKFREPGSVIVQMLLPIVYVCLGVFLSDSGFQVKSQDAPVDLTNTLYSPDFKQYFYGFQNSSGDTVADAALFDQFPAVTGREFEYIPDSASYGSLANSDLFSILNYTDHFSQLEMTLSYNDTAQHSIPILLNSLSNAFAGLYGIGNISVTSQPFRLTSRPGGFDGFSFGGGMLIGLTYIFIPIGFALELIEDREIRAKNQLRVNGLTFFLYFGSFFTVLGGMLLVLLCILLSLVAIFDFAALMLPPAFFIFSSMYLLYTIPALLFSACLSYLFDTIESGQFLFPIASYAGFIPYIAVMLCQAFNVLEGDLAKGFHIAFAFISPIYIPFGVILYITQQYIVCSISKTCQDLTISDYMITEVWVLYIALLFHIILWSGVLVVVDVVKDGGRISDLFSKRESVAVGENPDNISDEDEDVKKERERVFSLMNKRPEDPTDSPVIAVHQLRKVFHAGVDTKAKARLPCTKADEKSSSVKVAVRSLSISVRAGEVFGLLGHNGAGKTTTMRIIIAEEAATAGRVRIGDKDILSNQSEAFQEIGYCPQFDAVWKTITVKEHLEAYAAIRGVPPSAIHSLVKRYMDGLRITEHGNKYAKDCSGGTKRKLSYAMAMLGNPKIVLLDEPSTGMDPQSKRFVWNTIQASFRSERGAVLTTHSMEEADALCSRVGIMVKGELRCLGSTQHLKNKYGAGYMLEIKWKSNSGATQPDWESLEQYLQPTFPGLEVNEAFADRRSYSIVQSSVASLAGAFQKLETCKVEFPIEDYSFSQTTLEQVFIEFAKQQEMGDKEE